jgi:uncharacterized membrane protein
MPSSYRAAREDPLSMANLRTVLLPRLRHRIESKRSSSSLIGPVAMRYILAFLSLAGVLVSSLALQVHYSTATEPCSINERWDCGIVNHSSYAMAFGVPVAAIGIGGYLLLGVLALARRRFLLVVAAVVGLCFALHLSEIERNILSVWCLYCVISQGIIALITLLGAAWLAVHTVKNRRTPVEA